MWCYHYKPTAIHVLVGNYIIVLVKVQFGYNIIHNIY